MKLGDSRRPFSEVRINMGSYLRERGCGVARVEKWHPKSPNFKRFLASRRRFPDRVSSGARVAARPRAFPPPQTRPSRAHGSGRSPTMPRGPRAATGTPAHGLCGSLTPEGFRTGCPIIIARARDSSLGSGPHPLLEKVGQVSRGYFSRASRRPAHETSSVRR